MRILHFIPEITENKDVKKEFFRHLLKTSDGIEVRILTTDNDLGLENAEKITKILPILGKRIGKIIEEFHPDIIHIHGCTGGIELKLLRSAQKWRIPTIVSPSGSLVAIIFNDRSLTKRLTSDASRARKMIWGADAVHVLGEMEMETVRKLQIIPGKDISKDIARKIVMIKNSVLTNAITDEEMRHLFVQLYSKVICSRAYDVMLPDTKECERLILQNGVCHEFCNNSEDKLKLIANLNSEEMEKIFIHAEIEDVRDYMDKGCHSLGITTTPDSDACRAKAGLEERNNSNLFSDTDKIRSKYNKILRDFENYEEESQLFCTFAETRDKMSKGCLTYRHLAYITEILIKTEYREDIIMKLFKDSKIYDFAARLMQVAHDYTALPEGFMPVAPINDNKTKDIITFLTLKSR